MWPLSISFKFLIYRKTAISFEKCLGMQNIKASTNSTRNHCNKFLFNQVELWYENFDTIIFFKTLRICYFIDVNILKRKAYDAVNWSYKLMYHVIVTYIVGLKGLNGTKGLNLSWRRGKKREMSTDCKYDWSAKNNIFSALIYVPQMIWWNI